MSKRLITEKQQEILMLVHHDFECLSQKEAAERLGVTEATISEQLKAVKKALPQYFPILTALEYKCYNYYMNEGWNVHDVAEYLEMTENAVYSALDRAKKKGMWWAPPKGRVLSYDGLAEDYGIDWLDSKIKQKF